MKSILVHKIKHFLSLTLVMSLCFLLFSYPAFAQTNRSYERKISATISDRITVEGHLSIPNLIGILEMELPTEDGMDEATIYVVRDKAGSRIKIPDAEDDLGAYDENNKSGSVKVKLTSTNRPIYARELYGRWYDYYPDMGFSLSYDSGDGFSNSKGGELSYYYNGLNAGKVYFVYSEEELGYETLDEIEAAGLEDNLYSFWVGGSYILVLSDEDIEYFLKNDELMEYEGFKWPGLRDLLTAQDTYKNFTAKNQYTTGQFADVTNQWYSESVRKVYELGLMKGVAGGNFNPEGTITIGEAIAMAARLHNISSGGTGEFTQGSPWYQVYVDYAVKNGIIQQGDFKDYSLKVKRSEMAYIFSSAIPKTAIAKINNVDRLPDVNENTKYQESIFLLYRAGIITGNDAIGTFTPEANITRAQAAAIIARLALPDERKTLDF